MNHDSFACRFQLRVLSPQVEKQIVLLEHKVAQITEGEGSRIGALSEQTKRLEEGADRCSSSVK